MTAVLRDGRLVTLTPFEAATNFPVVYPDLYGHAALARYTREVGGITVQGVRVATDDRSKTMIMGARIKADADPTFTTPWAVGNTPIVLDAATVIAISDAVLGHIQACFIAWSDLVASIAAGNITTTAEIDAVFAAI